MSDRLGWLFINHKLENEGLEVHLLLLFLYQTTSLTGVAKAYHEIATAQKIYFCVIYFLLRAFNDGGNLAPDYIFLGLLDVTKPFKILSRVAVDRQAS